MAIERIDNGNGTTTFRGVDVTIPKSVADIYDVVAVRIPEPGERAETCGDVTRLDRKQGYVYPILVPRPTWKPPASLAPGEYLVQLGTLRTDELTLAGRGAIRQIFRDFTPPAIDGRWRVNKDGTATYLGEK